MTKLRIGGAWKKESLWVAQTHEMGKKMAVGRGYNNLKKLGQIHGKPCRAPVQVGRSKTGDKIG